MHVRRSTYICMQHACIDLAYVHFVLVLIIKWSDGGLIIFIVAKSGTREPILYFLRRNARVE
jgi:hypothetical protein